MSLLDVLKTAIWSLGSNKLRSGLTLLGIIIGVTAVIALMTIGRGVQQGITSRIEAQGANLLFVQPGATTTGGVSSGQGSASTLTLADAFALVDPIFAPSIKAAAPQIATNAQIVAGRENTNVQVIGITPEYGPVRNAVIEHGLFISQADLQANSQVAVLSASVSEELYGLLSPVGQTVRINGRQFTVVGVLEDNSVGFGQSRQVLIPITTAYYRLTAQRTAQGGVSVQSINVQAKNREVMTDAEIEVATILRLRHRITGDDDFIISSQQGLIETLNETTNALVIFLGTVAGISLFVGGIGVMNIMLVSVTERTREIGIRKAIGAKRRDILFQFITEAIILTMSGGFIGLVIGLSTGPLLNGRTLIGPRPIETGFSLDIAIIALVVSGAIGLFSGIYPALRAARMHPIDALRYE
ncbi:MAG: ABC transporter permease [Chloroflexi bacterium]|nr:ABC transporter permease [Chloroflexota bacterium]MCH8869395.1 ABC transporter permease [Chloroflexota bacterium]MCH9038288.1 ABC transporter permease [Chloroflexota bacterium]MCI0771258.1 ABC transporter permease [Chloroflexota bacterium]MCI0790843.1 ABC transporter permease [Chloroflexota bacterium]